MIRYVCYRDGTDLTHLVGHARAGAPDVPIVLKVTAEPPGAEEVEQQLAGSTKKTPVVLALDPAMLEDAEAPERAKEVVQRIADARGEQAEGGDPTTWQVIVTCPHDECENAFSSEVEADPATPTVIVGYPPNLTQRFLSEAAKELAPDKSLARASEAAKFVISNIALVALVVGGFGIFGDTKGGLDEHRALFGAIVAFAGLSLGLALWALFPSTKGGVNYDDLDAVAKAFKEAIEKRALFAQLSTAALIVALALALGAVFFAGEAKPTASISSSWDGSGERLILAVSVGVDSLPKDSTAEATVAAIRGEQATLLTRSNVRAAKNGSTKIDLKTVPIAKHKRYRVRSVIRWDKDKRKHYKRSRTDEVELTKPPFAPPPKARTQKAG